MYELILLWSHFGLLGTLGGLASYFYPPLADVRFAWRTFIGKLVTSFFVGQVAGEFIADDNTFKSGWVMLLGFFAYPVLAAFEIRVKDWINIFFKPPGL